MISSQIAKNDIILSLYGDVQTIFRLKETPMLSSETGFLSLNKKRRVVCAFTVHLLCTYCAIIAQ
jgi:hypothetical protein